MISIAARSKPTVRTARGDLDGVWKNIHLYQQNATSKYNYSFYYYYYHYYYY